MTKPAITMSVERMRVRVEQRHRELSRVQQRYLSEAERAELRQCAAWMKKHARGWERS